MATFRTKARMRQRSRNAHVHRGSGKGDARVEGRRRVPVIATIDGYGHRTTICDMGDGPCIEKAREKLRERASRRAP